VEVVATVRLVAQGKSLVSPGTIAGLVSRARDRELMRESLSPREREVLQLMAEGTTTREIARRLGISYATVRSHVRSISTKLGTKSKVNAVVTARQLELVN
jgi:DNA-binding NarL/FixJ family response regulator